MSQQESKEPHVEIDEPEPQEALPSRRPRNRRGSIHVLSQMKKINSPEALALTTEYPMAIEKVRIFEIPHLKEHFDVQVYDNSYFRTKFGGRVEDAHAIAQWDYSSTNVFRQKSKGRFVIGDHVRALDQDECFAFVRAASRPRIVWDPQEVRAGVVTCGGLCPGMNVVIQQLVLTLHYNYSVDTIWGFRFGLKGLCDPENNPPIMLTPHVVNGISDIGGTILGTARGNFEIDQISATLEKYEINQLFIIGGDGTHRAAKRIYDDQIAKGRKICVCGIPKTIDNDIGVIDSSFGFATAVEEAEKAITSAAVESRCNAGGIGLVKLMGRHAGFVAAHATLANTDVDICLIPEVDFDLEGENGICPLIRDLLDNHGKCVIVVAEGAGSHLMEASTNRDASGNKLSQEIGKFLKSQIDKYFAEQGRNVTIKYHDPSYMIRSIKPNAIDTVYCLELAQNAVHSAMAGYTGFSVGRVNKRSVLIPLALIDVCSPTTLNPRGHTWERVVRITHQRVDVGSVGGSPANELATALARASM